MHRVLKVFLWMLYISLYEYSKITKESDCNQKMYLQYILDYIDSMGDLYQKEHTWKFMVEVQQILGVVPEV